MRKAHTRLHTKSAHSRWLSSAENRLKKTWAGAWHPAWHNKADLEGQISSFNWYEPCFKMTYIFIFCCEEVPVFRPFLGSCNLLMNMILPALIKKLQMSEDLIKPVSKWSLIQKRNDSGGEDHIENPWTVVKEFIKTLQ